MEQPSAASSLKRESQVSSARVGGANVLVSRPRPVEIIRQGTKIGDVRRGISGLSPAKVFGGATCPNRERRKTIARRPVECRTATNASNCAFVPGC